MSKYCINCGKEKRFKQYDYCDICYNNNKTFNIHSYNRRRKFKKIIPYLIIGIIILIIIFINKDRIMFQVNCPQLSYMKNMNINDKSLNIKWNEVTQIHQQIYSSSLFEWKIQSYQLKGNIDCRKGNKNGENFNNFYCGSLELPTTYMVYNNIDKYGNIIDIKYITFINEYNENGMFVKTICGKTPEKIISEKTEEKKIEENREYNDLKTNIEKIKELFN